MAVRPGPERPRPAPGDHGLSRGAPRLPLARPSPGSRHAARAAHGGEASGPTTSSSSTDSISPGAASRTLRLAPGARPAGGRPKQRAALPIQTLLEEAPQIRVRNLSHRQMEQLGELVVANERLAGRPVSKARQRVEFLKRRREVWEMIYNRVTRRDAAATLAALEEAHKEVAAAISERSRERKSVGELKRQLVQLQAQVAAAHQQLHHTQELVQLNQERIQQLTLEAQAARHRRAARPSLAARNVILGAGLQALDAVPAALPPPPQGSEGAWAPVAFGADVSGEAMRVLRHGGKHWVLFRDAEGRAACIEDCCAHRACPLSLGKVVGGQAMCAYHGWKYDASGACTDMPSTVMCSGIAVPALACAEAGGLVWVAEPMAALRQPQPRLPAALPEGFAPVATAQAELPVEAGELRAALLGGPPVFADPACAPAWLCAAARLLLDAGSSAAQESGGGWLTRTVGEHVVERSALVPAAPGHTRWLYQLHVRSSHWAALPTQVWQRVASEAVAGYGRRFEGQQEAAPSA